MRGRRAAALGLALALTTGGLAACAEDEAQGLAAGEAVALEGEVQERLGPNAFTLAPDGTLVFGVEVPEVEEGVAVAVAGDVVVFSIDAFERELGVDLDDEAFAEFEGELAVDANQVDVVEED